MLVFFGIFFAPFPRWVRKVGYGEVEEVMSEFRTMNESGRYRAARAAKTFSLRLGHKTLW